LFLLAKGADFLVDGSCTLARKFKIPEIIIGLTIVSIGTSLPELIISATAALNGNSDISIGNIIGSNLANLFLIIGICCILKPIHAKKQSRFIDQPLVVIVTFLLFMVVHNDGIISRKEGMAFVLCTVLYLIYTIEIARYGKKLNKYSSTNEKEIKKEKGIFSKNKVAKRIIHRKNAIERRFPVFFAIFSIAFGVVLLKYGGDITVDNAVLIAGYLGLSEKLIALTIVAVGTSLPELITCLEASKKGASDLILGNIAGSQIFNIILILGVSSSIKPIYGALEFEDEIMIILVGNIIFAIAPFLNERHRVGRLMGIGFVVVYFAYMLISITEQLTLQR